MKLVLSLQIPAMINLSLKCAEKERLSSTVLARYGSFCLSFSLIFYYCILHSYDAEKNLKSIQNVRIMV